jgi:acyl-CoA reductase-like NAD-dependent aldehyde dehydrogenase
LAPGVALHAHGSGFGVCVVDESAAIEALAPRIAEDIALFDQRGCLSPRALLVQGDLARAEAFARAIAAASSALEVRVPRGRLAPDELAEISRFRDTASYVGDAIPAGLGFVAVAPSEAFALAPVGRNLYVLATDDPRRVLSPFGPMLTSCAVAAAPALRDALRRALPGARVCEPGEMQRPPFDGPVDRREA